MDSILLSVKKMLGIAEQYEHFDQDIIMHINSVFMILNQLGVGPDEAFSIRDKRAVWNDFIEENQYTEAVKSYIYLRVRLLFDPPTTGPLSEAIERQLKELEWRMDVYISYLKSGQSDLLNIIANGTYDVSEYTKVNVAVPSPSGTVTITTNGEHDVKAYETADVNVPNTYTEADDGKVVDNGALVSQTARELTENGTFDTTLNNEVTVDVPIGDEYEIVTLWEGTITELTPSIYYYYSEPVTENVFDYLRVTVFCSGTTTKTVIIPTSENVGVGFFIGGNRRVRGLGFIQYNVSRNEYWWRANTDCYNVQTSGTTVENTSCIPRKIEGIRKKSTT